MATRRPLVNVAGSVTELPVGDTVFGAGGNVMPIVPMTGNVTVNSGHQGGLFINHSSSAYVITVPTALYSATDGFTFGVLQAGTGSVTVAGSGVTVYSSGTAATSAVGDRLTVVLTDTTSATVIKSSTASSGTATVGRTAAIATYGKTSGDSVAYFESFVKTTVSDANPYPRELIFIPSSVAPLDPKISIAISGCYTIDELNSGGSKIYSRTGYQSLILGVGDYLTTVANGGGTGMLMRAAKGQWRVDLANGTSAVNTYLEWTNSRGGIVSASGGAEMSGWQYVYAPFDGGNPAAITGSHVISLWFRAYIGGNYSFPTGNANPSIYCLQE